MTGPTNLMTFSLYNFALFRLKLTKREAREEAKNRAVKLNCIISNLKKTFHRCEAAPSQTAVTHVGLISHLHP